jgi:pyruvate formate lyase activating enzyme
MPDELAGIAESCRKDGNIGVAFTYNEPLISYEYVRDTARLLHEKGMAVVLVSNGMASKEVLSELAGSVDAMNIDLKGFTDRYYRDVLKGDRRMVMEFIEDAVKMCHVELTTLIVPGENDSENEIRELAGWIAGLTNADGNVIGRSIPLHISRFFPRFHMRDRGPTPVAQVYRLAEAAREMLEYVYTGNC